MRTSSSFNQQFIEGFSTTPEPLPDGPEPYWVRLQHDRQQFYEVFLSRQDELKKRYGSAPVVTKGPLEPGITARKHKAREAERDRLDRLSACDRVRIESGAAVTAAPDPGHVPTPLEGASE